MKNIKLPFLTILIALAFSSISQASAIECRGNGMRIVVTYSPSTSSTNALLYKVQPQNNQYQLIAQYQVISVASQYDFQGKGFSIYIGQNTTSPTGWIGSYQAEVVSEPGSYSGQAVCQIPPPTPSSCGARTNICYGMQTPVCWDGHWHCIGGGH